jgi:hypothetical protein
MTVLTAMAVMAEPFTAHLLPDLLRVALIAATLLLIALVLRLMWTRRHDDPEIRAQHVHPATMLSYCVLLGMVVARRTEALGTPAEGWLLAATAAVGVGYYGVLQRVRLAARPPWRRR